VIPIEKTVNSTQVFLDGIKHQQIHDGAMSDSHAKGKPWPELKKTASKQLIGLIYSFV
jgi:hypothetical protein|tara:strand:- start:5894 stop:6067 length:174 start_codon:yes stop_codon:yes gene_type:complete